MAKLAISDMRSASGVNAHIHPLQVAAFIIVLLISIGVRVIFKSPEWVPLIGLLVGIYLLFSLQVAVQWEKAAVLRAGKFTGLYGPGLFMIVPVLDSVTGWVDHRVITTNFSAEQTLTMDTVPVDVDAVLFWMVWDAQKAVLEVQDYQQAVFWSAQTALREIIGRNTLAEMLRNREKLDIELKKSIDDKTNPWGITVQSVEIRDVIIPGALQDAMSREAQAERERHARVILSAAEKEIMQSFLDAGKEYEKNPTALHLRAMNMLFECMKEKGGMIVVPSTAVQSMGLGTITGLTAMAEQAVSGTGSAEVGSIS